MLPRGLFGRLVPDVSKTASLDVSQLSRSFQQLSLARNLSRTPRSLHNGSVLSFQSLGGCRAYTVTASRCAEATRTRTAAKSASKRKTATKKAAPKKKPVKKAKRATKKKKAAKKPVRRRKVLTEKQKAALQEKKTKEKLKQLKVTALPTVPKGKPATAWLVYNVEHRGKQLEASKENAAKFKALSPAELEHYNRIANQNKAENERTYRAWVTSHTPEQIRQANLARARLRRAAKRPHSKNFRRIEDDRVPKAPQNSYTLFVKERFDSGDLKNMPLASAGKLIGDEWKALSAFEKQKYTSQAESLKAAYLREYKSVYGHPPGA